jgi:hypothetical protein
MPRQARSSRANQGSGACTLPSTPQQETMNQDFKKTLRATADKLRTSMKAAECRQIVLGRISINCISDTSFPPSSV